MAENMSSEGVLNAVGLQVSEKAQKEFTASGIVPAKIASTEIKKTLTILGITPEDFVEKYSSVEFDFRALQTHFADYCKDFKKPLEDNVGSKSLEFAAKIIFEYGPYIRTEKKTKGDKAIRFRFPYKKEDPNGREPELKIKVVIVTTFKDIACTDTIVDDKMILTFRQAGLLAMVTFSDAITYAINKNGMKLMTPLCGSVFSRDSITDMARELNIDEGLCLMRINESAASGGQYLDSSDLSCAIACMISTTRRITNKNIRDSMISRVIKQYTHQKKEYNGSHFMIYAKYALGGVPVGLDSETLIETFINVQAQQASMRAKAAAISQSATTLTDQIVHYDPKVGKPGAPTGSSSPTKKK